MEKRKFKIGDIVFFDREHEPNYRSYLYNKKHIVTYVDTDLIRTQGYGWDYTDHGSRFSELETWNPDGSVKLCDDKSHGSKLIFNFIDQNNI